MAYNLRNRSFLKELDFNPDELRYLLRLSAELKAAKYGGYERPRLRADRRLLLGLGLGLRLGGGLLREDRLLGLSLE